MVDVPVFLTLTSIEAPIPQLRVTDWVRVPVVDPPVLPPGPVLPPPTVTPLIRRLEIAVFVPAANDELNPKLAVPFARIVELNRPGVFWKT